MFCKSTLASGITDGIKLGSRQIKMVDRGCIRPKYLNSPKNNSNN